MGLSVFHTFLNPSQWQLYDFPLQTLNHFYFATEQKKE